MIQKGYTQNLCRNGHLFYGIPKYEIRCGCGARTEFSRTLLPHEYDPKGTVADEQWEALIINDDEEDPYGPSYREPTHAELRAWRTTGE